MKKLSYYLEIAARIYVFISLSVYGWAKLFGMQFYRQGRLPEQVKMKTLESLSGFDIAWTFFGYSYPYILFIGISQVTGAFLLLFNRTKLLGGAILIPILLNIIIVDICFQVPDGAMLNACFYLMMILVMLWLNKQRIVEALTVLTGASKPEGQTLNDFLKTGGLVIVIFALGMAFIYVFSRLLAFLK